MTTMTFCCTYINATMKITNINTTYTKTETYRNSKLNTTTATKYLAARHLLQHQHQPKMTAMTYHILPNAMMCTLTQMSRRSQAFLSRPMPMPMPISPMIATLMSAKTSSRSHCQRQIQINPKTKATPTPLLSTRT